MAYSLEDLTGHFERHDIQGVQGHPNFRHLIRLKNGIINALKHLQHPDHSESFPKTGWMGMIMSEEEFETYSNKEWIDPINVGTHWQAKTSHLCSEIEKTNDHNQWKADRALYMSFINLQTILTQLLAKLIHSDYHFTTEGEISGPDSGFGMATPKEIINGLMLKYGKTTYGERAEHLHLLDTPIDRNAPLEKYLRTLETATRFFLTAADCDPLTDSHVIMKASIALSGLGIFGKTLRKWKDSGHTTWKEFRVHMIKASEEITEDLGDGATLGGEGYSTDVAYLGVSTAPKEEEDDGSLGGSIVELANHTEQLYVNQGATEEKLDNALSRLAALELHSQSQAAYAAQASIPPTNIQFQAHKKRKNETQFPPSVPPMPYAPQAYNPAPPTWNHQQTQQGHGQGTPAFGNVTKFHDNNFYCFTCGFDVSHPGSQCPTPKQGHVPHAHRDNAHQFHGACMKAAHKLWQGKPAMAATLGLNVRRASYATQQQPPPQQGFPPYHLQYQGRGRSGRGGGRGRNGRGGGRGRGNQMGYGYGYGQGNYGGGYGYNGNYQGGRGGGYGYGYQH